MKKALITLVCIICGLTASAQDCPLCGDWHGVISEDYLDQTVDKLRTGNIKYHIRIRKNGDGYIVREKWELPDGRILYDDFEDYKYYTNEDNPMFIGWEESKPDVEYELRLEDGRYLYRYEYYLRYNIVVEGNKMTFRRWVGIDKYRRYGPYYPDNSFGDFSDIPERERKFEKTITLYRDNGDW